MLLDKEYELKNIPMDWIIFFHIKGYLLIENSQNDVGSSQSTQMASEPLTPTQTL